MFVSMDVSVYIKDLLYRYECIILPGFGAFLTQYEPARIENGQHFYPPGKRVSFNRQLQTNDGLLANYVASIENCNYEVALQRIRNFSGTISLELAEGKTISFPNIGSFSLTSENKVTFTPTSEINYNRSSFGLSTYSASKIVREPIEKIPSKHTLKKVKETNIIPWMRYAAVGLIAITLGSISGLKIYESNVESYNYSERQKADTRLEKQIQEATFVIENPFPEITLSIPKETGKYHIVAGAFRMEDNAKKKLNQLITQGYPAKNIGVNRYGLHQVIYQSFSDRLEALSALRKIKVQENAAAWLLVKDFSK